MNELHLFSGVGGGILGGMLLGHTCVCAVEIEPYRRKVLLQRQRDGILPKFPIWDDVRTFDGKPWRKKVEVVCGGFPCQDISVAGSGAGINGNQSGLWNEFVRVLGEVRPIYAFIENSPAIAFRGFDRVLCDLAGMGLHARWGVFSACSVGLPHPRQRMFCLGYSNEARKCGHIQYAQVKKIGRQSSLVESEPPRMVDELANRVERHDAIGDGQVPAVVKLAWETLMGQK